MDAIMETAREGMEWVAFALETLAVAVIAGGVVLAAVRCRVVRELIQPTHPDFVERFKHQLVRGLLLGLDLLVASDVIHTAAVKLTLYNVATLGLLVMVRIVLTWSLVVESEGRLPWQSSAPTAPEEAAGR